jgi:putative membrane protein
LKAPIIKSMTLPASQANGEVVPPTDQQAMAHLDSTGRALYEKLQGLSGRAFEMAYLDAEVEGHQKLLSIQNVYLSDGRDREELDFAKLVKGMILEHLQLLRDLRSA